MMKVFLSHSSAQKEFARKVAEIIGYDQCIIDERTFESGKLILEEIIEALEKSGIFVLLLSDEALKSTWVNEEINKVRDLLDNGRLRYFRPYIIDASISHTDPRIKSWIKKDYLLEYYSSPILLARKINEALREITWEKFPAIKQKEKLFLGRNNDIQRLETLYFDGNTRKRRAIIVAGYPIGIGRRKLLTQFIIEKITTNKSDTYEPIAIELSNGQSIEDFIMQMNNCFLLFDEATLLRILSSNREEKRDAAVKLSNYMADKKERVLIRDNGVCVLSSGELSTWFKELVTSPNLQPQLHFFLASQYFLRDTIGNNLPEIISIQIQPLNNTSAKALFYGYATITNENFDISEDDANFFIHKASGLPTLLFRCADLLNKYPIDKAKCEILPILESEDKNIKMLLEDFSSKDKEDHLQILILLSKFEFISFDLLKKFTKKVETNLDEILYDFYSRSLYETFGSNNQYLRLNIAISEYINRSRLELHPELRRDLKHAMQDYLTNGNDEYSSNDLSSFLINIREIIKTNPRVVREQYLIPSIFLKVINDEYKKNTTKGNKIVIDLCYRILEDSRRYYEEIIEDIRFWLCSALAKEQDRRFFEQIKFFSGYSELFLKGFYYRCGRKYEEAERYYRKAIDHNSKFDRFKDKRHMSKAKHEMVIVLQKQGRYEDALNLARENYEAKPTNTYYIVSYFRSLVRSKHPDALTLKMLLKELGNSLDAKKDILLATLKGEQRYYFHGDFLGAINVLKDAIQTAGKHRIIPFNSLKNICKKQDAEAMATSIANEFHIDTEEDEKIEEE